MLPSRGVSLKWRFLSSKLLVFHNCCPASKNTFLKGYSGRKRLVEWPLLIGHNALPWKACPGRVSGTWVFRDTRLPVATVIENLEDLSIEGVAVLAPPSLPVAVDSLPHKGRQPGSGKWTGRKT